MFLSFFEGIQPSFYLILLNLLFFFLLDGTRMSFELGKILLHYSGKTLLSTITDVTRMRFYFFSVTTGNRSCSGPMWTWGLLPLKLACYSFPDFDNFLLHIHWRQSWRLEGLCRFPESFLCVTLFPGFLPCELWPPGRLWMPSSLSSTHRDCRVPVLSSCSCAVVGNSPGSKRGHHKVYPVCFLSLKDHCPMLPTG